MNRYIVEFIGTFFLVFTVGLAAVHGGVTGGAGAFGPLAIGAILMCMIFAGGHISGAHYNPAVTIAVWWRGKCGTTEMPLYWAAQIAGGVLAGILVLALKGAAGGEPLPKGVLQEVLVVEFLYTFALAFVVLNVATAKSNANNSFYGLAIGFTVAAGAFTVGGISGGVFNPAVASGLLVMGALPIANLWMYLAAQLAAGLVAAIVFKIVNPGD